MALITHAFISKLYRRKGPFALRANSFGRHTDPKLSQIESKQYNLTRSSAEAKQLGSSQRFQKETEGNKVQRHLRQP